MSWCAPTSGGLLGDCCVVPPSCDATTFSFWQRIPCFTVRMIDRLGLENNNPHGIVGVPSCKYFGTCFTVWIDSGSDRPSFDIEETFEPLSGRYRRRVTSGTDPGSTATRLGWTGLQSEVVLPVSFDEMVNTNVSSFSMLWTFNDPAFNRGTLYCELSNPISEDDVRGTLNGMMAGIDWQSVSPGVSPNAGFYYGPDRILESSLFARALSEFVGSSTSSGGVMLFEINNQGCPFGFGQSNLPHSGIEVFTLPFSSPQPKPPVRGGGFSFYFNNGVIPTTGAPRYVPLISTAGIYGCSSASRLNLTVPYRKHVNAGVLKKGGECNTGDPTEYPLQCSSIGIVGPFNPSGVFTATPDTALVGPNAWTKYQC